MPPSEPVKTLHNYIGGMLLPPESSQYFDDLEPATGNPLARVPDSDARDIARAVTAASAAFPAWSTTPAAERSRLPAAVRRV